MTDVRKSRCEVLIAALVAANGAGLTRRQAATALGLKAMGYIGGLMEDLVLHKMAVKKEQTTPNGLRQFVYFPTDEAVQYVQ